MERKYDIEELQSLSGISRRTIRYYITEELVAPPEGGGRGSYYNDSHLDRLLQIRSLRDRGMRLDEIGAYLRKGRSETNKNVGNVWIRYEIAAGIELQVRRDVDETHRDRIGEILRFAAQLIKEGGKRED